MSASVVPVLFIAFITRSYCELTNGYNYNNGNDVSQFGGILKPPPPPPLSIYPVPFHGGVGRLRQNNNHAYQYQPPPSPPAPPITSDFKFPAPFYKQYNFNFVPPPQPFSTTPSPSLFQKVSGWLFPSQQVASDSGTGVTYNVAQGQKKDCNPCNLVPWIPVIRYDLAPNNGRQNLNPTYGPPSPTTNTNFNIAQPFTKPNQQYSNIPQSNQAAGIPHSVYGPPITNTNNHPIKFQSSTYGPPSPTHTVTISNDVPSNAQFSSSLNYDVPNTSIGPYSTNGLTHTPQSASSSIYNFASSSYVTPLAYNQFPSTTHNPVSTNYNNIVLNHNAPSPSDLNNKPSKDLQLPKVSNPTTFKNSYGEPIINTYSLDNPYSVSAPAASTKIKTEVLPDNSNEQFLRSNRTLALANPAPFSLNKGRNIHTLQPVALPNLSVSPLPPIFNARPFRTIPADYYSNILQSINHLQKNNVNIAKSVPIAEYTQSIDYPTTIIQSPVIDIDELNKINQSKAYRNIPNSYEIDEIPQASEDHVSATKTSQDVSFENMNTGFTNDLYDNIPLDIKQSINPPFNHKVSFADLRGMKDEDVDKYRTESNLQHIDSPLLYLKPSAPHKNFKNFMFITSTPRKSYEFEIYDDYTPTTSNPKQSANEITESNTGNFENSYHESTEEENKNRPKIVQIIVPYTTTDQRVDNNNNNDLSDQQDLMSNIEQEYQARKIQSHTESNYYSFATETISSIMTTTEDPISTTTDTYDMERINTPEIQNDPYVVKEPPFDIIKLQHTIDDWTEQEYSKHYHHIPRRIRPNEKYAKQIPDEYLTTISPITSFTTDNSFNYDLYDHEGSSSIQHAVIENRTNDIPVNRKEYSFIHRNKTNHNRRTNEESESNKKPHVYTAASTFRISTTTSTTPAPWGHIQTSISPLTNEKVYVVTSKPWKDKNETNGYEYEINEYNSKRVELDDSSELESFPFKSPRFSNRPAHGFTAGVIEPKQIDSPYGFSKGLYRKINNLQNSAFTSNENTYYEEDKEQNNHRV